MNFDTYYRNLKRPAREAYAERAGTTSRYIEVHLLHRRRTPKRDLMERLANASQGNLSYRDIVSFFLFEAA